MKEVTNMNIKRLKLINNIIFYSATIFAVGVLIKTYIDRARLPEGVCPANTNAVWIYISIGLLVCSFVVNILLSLKERQLKKDIDGDIEDDKDVDKDEDKSE